MTQLTPPIGVRWIDKLRDEYRLPIRAVTFVTMAPSRCVASGLDRTVTHNKFFLVQRWGFSLFKCPMYIETEYSW